MTVYVFFLCFSVPALPKMNGKIISGREIEKDFSSKIIAKSEKKQNVRSQKEGKDDSTRWLCVRCLHLNEVIKIQKGSDGNPIEISLRHHVRLSTSTVKKKKLAIRVKEVFCANINSAKLAF